MGVHAGHMKRACGMHAVHINKLNGQRQSRRFSLTVFRLFAVQRMFEVCPFVSRQKNENNLFANELK
jgi:hypothetical protein